MKNQGSPLQPSMNKGLAKPKPNDRIERLREWQKTREEAKAKANSQSKRPVFAIRSCGAGEKLASKNSKANVSIRPQFSFSTKKILSPKAGSPSIKKNAFSSRPKKATTTTYSTKSAVLCMSPKPVHQLPPSSRVTRPPSSRPVLPKEKAKELITSQQNAVKKPAKSIAKKTSEPRSTTQTVLPTRHSTRLAKKQTVPSVAQQTAAVKASEASNISKKTAGKAAVSKKSATRASEKIASSGRSAPTGKKGRKGKKSPGKKQPAAAEPELEPACVLPVTPKKSYKPVHPSPLLNCRSASRRPLRKPSSDEAAWIPGAPAPDCALSPSFENVFSANFSPFRFAAGSDLGQDFQFDFRMDLQEAAKSTSGAECDVAAETANVSQDSLVGSESTYQPNSSHTSAAQTSDGTLTSDNAPTCVLDDLMTFSDTSDCSVTEELDTPRLRRSTRNIGRKCYSSTKRCQNPAAPGSSTSDEVENTPKSAKKSRKTRSQLSGEDAKDVVSSAAGAASTTSADPSLPSEDLPANKLQPKSSRRKSRRSSRRVSTVAVEKVGEEVARNLEADYDSGHNLEADYNEENCGIGE